MSISMRRSKTVCLILVIAALWLTVASAAAATWFSDGVFTFDKTKSNTAVIVDCELTEKNIEVPEFILGYPVEGIGDFAFLNHGYESVTLPSSVVSIGEYAFAENEGLKYVTIPHKCESIADNAFFKCPKLTIRCYKGTAADAYAQKNQIPCEYLTGTTTGDANADGCINIKDVTAIQLHLAGLKELKEEALDSADFDQNGKIEIADAKKLQSKIMKYQ